MDNVSQVSQLADTSTTPASNQMPPQANTTKRIILFIGIVVLLLLLSGVGAYYVLASNQHDNLQTSDELSESRSETPRIVTSSPTITDTESTVWEEFDARYVSYKIPQSWQLEIHSNSEPGVIEYFDLFQSEKENDGSYANSYQIRVLNNNQKFDAMTFAKNNVASIWKPSVAPNYQKYESGDLDAVLVTDLSAGKGAWGPGVYFVNDSYAAHIISVEPISSDDKYFKTIIDSFSFQPTPISSLGHSCGKNAGAAGNAQCIEGFTCKYATKEEELNGIGTCVKE